MEVAQPDHLPILQSFHHWIRDISIHCSTTSQDGVVQTITFIPCHIIRARFSSDDYSFVEQLRDAVLGPKARSVSARDIALSCPVVFSILLCLKRGPYILQFVPSYDLHDIRLPLVNEPPDFPVGQDSFWNAFYEKQWDFCAPIIRSANLTEFRPDFRLPFVSRERLAGGGSATVDKVVIHKDYDELRSVSDEDHPSSPHTYAIKTYTGPFAEAYYQREVSAFMRLADNARKYPSPSMIRYYGSYTHRNTYNVLLEYADGGTLDDYFKTQKPPQRARDIIAFWQSLFEVIKALARLHEQELSDNDPRGLAILQGWHQDIKPANILIVRRKNASPYEWDFKLADLGLSHFEEVSSAQHDSPGLDTDGTRTYGAPECYAWTEFLQRQRLNVKRSTDMWSVGCVFSEAAVWVVSSWSGVLDYRQLRSTDEDRHPGFLGGNCFHNGRKVRKSVVSTHDGVRDDIRKSDFMTGEVLEMVRHLLRDEPDARTWAKQLIYDADEAVRKAKRQLAQKQSTSPSAGRSDPFSPFRPTSSESGPSYRSRNERESRGSQRSGRSPILNELYTASPQESMADSDYFDEEDESYPSLPANMNALHVTESPRTQTDLTGTTGVPAGAQERDWPMTSPKRADTNLSKRRVAQSHNAALSESAGEPSGTASSPTRQGPPRRSQTTASSSRRPQALQESVDRGMAERIVAESRCPPIDPHQPPEIDTDLELAKKWQAEEDAKTAVERATNNVTPRLLQAQTADAPRKVASNATKLIARQPPDFLSVANAIQWRTSRGQGELDHAKYQGYLDQRDHVFLIDDSASMAPYGREMLALLDLLAYMVKKGDPDGPEVFFMMDSRSKRSKTSTGLVRLARSVQPSGTADPSIRLGYLIQRYQNEIQSQAMEKRHWLRGIKPVKNLNIYVMTTGMWQPGCDLTRIFTDLVDRLVKSRVGHAPIGVQFIRFGRDQDGIKRLEHLDSGLNLVLDVVDTEPSNGNVWKMLLGAINSWFDDDPQPGSSSTAAAR